MPELHCTLLTPEATVADDEATLVVVPLYDGELGIAPGHTPMIGLLGFGELRLRRGNALRQFYVDGGFVEVRDDVVSVLSDRIVPAETIDEDAASEQLASAQAAKARTPEQIDERFRAAERARAQLRVARRVAP